MVWGVVVVPLFVGEKVIGRPVEITLVGNLLGAAVATAGELVELFND